LDQISVQVGYTALGSGVQFALNSYNHKNIKS